MPMNRAAYISAAFVGSIALAMTPSCEPIVGRPLTEAPVNTCAANACDAYEPGAKVRARCTNERCEIPGRPEFQFFLVVHVPDTSIFAPGITFVLKSDLFTKTPDPSSRSLCTPPTCLLLPSLRNVTGYYTVTKQASINAGYPLEEGTSIPVRAEYVPVAPNTQCSQDPAAPIPCIAEAYPQLPLDKTFVASSRIDATTGVPIQFARVVPPGRYARVLFPQPPFDAFFPPSFAGSLVDTGTPAQLINVSEYIDKFELGSTKTPIDDVVSDTRVVKVSREDGLDGFRVWLADHATGRRISTLRTLSGKTATVRLDTSGESAPGGGLRDDVDAVVAPPASYVAVPRYVTNAVLGRVFDYPPIPPPAAVTGVVAVPSTGAPDETLLGYPATISFTSEVLKGLSGNPALLRYETNVSTDDRGRFSTLLPPGTYRAIVSPAEGTGFARQSQLVTIESGPTTLTLRPPLRTAVTGRVLLTDERPLAEAEIIAQPGESPLGTTAPAPRPARTTTAADGRFSMELDPGPYVLTVMPKAGTGFPWLVTRSDIPAKATDLPDIRVPAPTRLSFTLRDPGSTGNPIVRAIVRIFAAPASDPSAKPLEIGMAMTDPKGFVEILLAQQPR